MNEPHSAAPEKHDSRPRLSWILAFALGLRPEWADRIVWRSRAKYCQVFIEEVGRLPD